MLGVLLCHDKELGASLTDWKDAKRSFRESVSVYSDVIGTRGQWIERTPIWKTALLSEMVGRKRKQRWNTLSSFALFPKWLPFVLISLLPQKITSFSLFNVELHCSQAWVFLGLGLHWGCNIKLWYPETFPSWSLAFCHTYWLWDHRIYGSRELT